MGTLFKKIHNSDVVSNDTDDHKRRIIQQTKTNGLETSICLTVNICRVHFTCKQTTKDPWTQYGLDLKF
jgi:hypothetical protein